MTPLIAEDLFDALTRFNAKCARATQQRQWSDFYAAQKELHQWFAERNIQLVARDTQNDPN